MHPEACQRGEAETADREGHGRERRDGGEHHHDADHAEQSVRQVVDQGGDALALLAHADEGEAEQYRHDQYRHDQYRHDLAPGEVADDVDRNHFEQEIEQGHRLRARYESGDRFGIQGRWVDMHAGAGRNEVTNRGAHEKCQSRYKFKIKDGTQADHADASHVAHFGDAGRDGAEHDGWDDRAHQADERVADGFQCNGGVRRRLADDDARDDAYQDLDVKRLESPLHTVRGFTTTLIASSTRSRA
jgi:hypothetical protein